MSGTFKTILNQTKLLGIVLEPYNGKLRARGPIGVTMPPELAQEIRSHAKELLNYLKAKELSEHFKHHGYITRKQYDTLEPSKQQYWQPATGKGQTLTWEKADKLFKEGAREAGLLPEPGSVEYEADRLLLESTRRIAKAWPKGCDLDANPRWRQAEGQLHAAYHSGNLKRLRAVLELREQLALKLFEAYRRQRAA